MRMRYGVAMPEKGGRTAIIGVEVAEGREPGGRLAHQFTVGLIDRVQPFTIDAARQRVIELMDGTAQHRPCAILEVKTPQGLALHQSLRGKYSAALHKPHAFAVDNYKGVLFSNFLQAYSLGRVLFRPGLKHRSELDKALVFYMGGGVGKHGVDLESEDDALVLALGLSLQWPKHGGPAKPWNPQGGA